MENENAVVTAPQSTLALAIEKGMDPATISKLMDLQERWEANLARKEYVEAMAGFKRECPSVIGKDKRADFGAGKAKYSYATTGAIVTAITPALSKYGLSLSWESSQKDRTVTVTCHVTHQGGHRESATLTGPHDESGGKNPIQTLGSSVHYLQRYTMVSVLGLATADMNDPDAGATVEPISEPRARGEAPANTQDGCQVAIGILENVTEKAMKGDKGPYVIYGLFVGGERYGSFDKAIAETAKPMKGKEVRVTWALDGKYKTAKGVELAAGGSVGASDGAGGGAGPSGEVDALLAYADGFPKMFAKGCVHVGIAAEGWQTAPADALTRLKKWLDLESSRS